MKKILTAVSFCLLLSSVFAGAGIGVKYGIAPSDTGISLQDENKPFYGFEVFIEKAVEKNALGLRIGLNKHNDINTFALLDGNGVPVAATFAGSLKSELYAIPLTLYYKYEAMEKLHIIIGGGVTYGYYSWSYDMTVSTTSSSYALSGSHSSGKLFPHAGLGLEWRVDKNIGIGLDMTYNSQSKTNINEKNGGGGAVGFCRGIDGIQSNIAARYYF